MDQDRALSPVQHMWSLAVEEQFYLLWPVTLLLVWAVLSRRDCCGNRRHPHGGLVPVADVVNGTDRTDPAAYFSSLTRRGSAPLVHC